MDFNHFHCVTADHVLWNHDRLLFLPIAETSRVMCESMPLAGKKEGEACRLMSGIIMHNEIITYLRC